MVQRLVIAAALSLQSTGSRGEGSVFVAHRLELPLGLGIFLNQQANLVSPALAGSFIATGAPEVLNISLRTLGSRKEFV